MDEKECNIKAAIQSNSNQHKIFTILIREARATEKLQEFVSPEVTSRKQISISFCCLERLVLFMWCLS
ncbi:CLUMA_CG000706, isoform A [Clunio marinus]|uniref:CLUMA_CG000706, isoform A n=1 Tax=Clunio marinus TaxID=568069 RepID=A0A1J1HKW9_9DIPT|nr:CLUMA_CG000706, isoform A [Clunio marinus]